MNGFLRGWVFPFYSATAFLHPPTIIAPKTPHFSLARDVPKPRDADTKTKTYFLVVFHWSHAVPCPKSQGMSAKRLVSTELGILGQLGIFWGGMEIVLNFPFYSGPMLSHVPKAKGCRQKDSKLGILWYRQKLVFWDSCVFWSKLEKVFHFIVVPCCHVPKPRDVDKKTPKWVFCGIDRAGYSGAAGCFRAG